MCFFLFFASQISKNISSPLFPSIQTSRSLQTLKYMSSAAGKHLVLVTLACEILSFKKENREIIEANAENILAKSTSHLLPHQYVFHLPSCVC
jgi:hypothetical protein